MSEAELRKLLEGAGDQNTFLKNYIVEAGAGAGKSTTMVRRITNLLLNDTAPCSPEQLVVITFTVKATQELQNKLEQNFRALVAAHPDEPRYRELANSVGLIQVSTIDSFCQKLLTTMPFSNPLGMSGIRETDDQERGRDFLDRRYLAGDRLFREVGPRFNLRRDFLENVFLSCCGRGDSELVYEDPAKSPVMELEETQLPLAVKVIRGMAAYVKKNYPQFAGYLTPDFEALLAIPDRDCQKGGAGLDAYMRWSRRCSSLDGVLDKDKCSQYLAPYLEFTDGLKAIWDNKFGKKDIPDPAAAETARKALQTLLDSSPDYPRWIAPQIKALADKYKTGIGPKDKAAKDELVSCFISHKSYKSRCSKDWQESQEKLDQVKEYLKAAIWPKDVNYQDDPNGLPAITKRLIHSYVLREVTRLLKDYRAEKLSIPAATFNDCLVMARNMLRDDKEAREYFHDRYRVFYVDEFQDTDEIQSELLFYLSARDGGFDGTDWRKCRPAPGSLFLVGDPKQAIYRFRGADIDTYNQVVECFKSSGVGELVNLSFNFRSTKEICDLSETVFKPLLKNPDDPGSPAPPAKKYQADFAPMTAVLPGSDPPFSRGPEPLSRIFSYQTVVQNGDSRKEKDIDPERVAAFVKHMVDSGITVAARGGNRPVRYEDFLILTYTKKSVNAYARSFRELGIPVNITGEEGFFRTAAIRRARPYLQYLMKPGDELRLGIVLDRCYGIDYSAMRRLKQRGGLYGIGSVYDTERDSQNKPVRRLEALYAALLLEQPQDGELLRLCDALREIGSLQDMLRSGKPAMAVLERLYLGVGCLWPRKGKRQSRRADYGRVQQFLEKLRGEKYRDFSALAEAALRLSRESVENELPLEGETGCAHIMNLHKAKGLEGEIVVLTYHNQARQQEPVSHLERAEAAGKAGRLHLRLTNRTSHGTLQDLARGADWRAMGEEEARFLTAEQTRLLYVAATRAKSMLLVSESSRWKPIWEKIGELSPAAGNSRSARLQGTAQLKALADAAKTPEEKALADCLSLLNPGMKYPWASAAAPASPAAQVTGTPPPPPTPVDVAPDVLEAQLAELAKASAEALVRAITPSRLDKASRSTQLRKDRVDEETDEGRSDEERTPAVQAPLPSGSGPHGADWGTLVHRVMELAVSRQSFDADSLLRFSEQAVFETFDNVILSEARIRLLDGKPGSTRDQLLASVAAAAARNAAFLSRDDSPLRELLRDGACLTELPFNLLEKDRKSELYRHLAEHLGDGAEEERPLEVQGVIDLAIHKGGSWTIVDYKTDIPYGGETEETFRARLRREYTPQIQAYARVLERLGQGEVGALYLCSIPLGGALIPLALREAEPLPEPTVAPTGPVPKAAEHAAPRETQS